MLKTERGVATRHLSHLPVTSDKTLESSFFEGMYVSTCIYLGNTSPFIQKKVENYIKVSFLEKSSVVLKNEVSREVKLGANQNSRKNAWPLFCNEDHHFTGNVVLRIKIFGLCHGFAHKIKRM